jgi:hypothetical protein
VADISDVTFLDNSVSGAVDWRAYVMGIAGGGALLVFGSDMGGGASVRVSRCRFESNTVNATDLYPPPSDSSGQGSLAKGTMFLHLTIVKQALIGSVSPPPPWSLCVMTTGSFGGALAVLIVAAQVRNAVVVVDGIQAVDNHAGTNLLKLPRGLCLFMSKGALFVLRCRGLLCCYVAARALCPTLLGR